MFEVLLKITTITTNNFCTSYEKSTSKMNVILVNTIRPMIARSNDLMPFVYLKYYQQRKRFNLEHLKNGKLDPNVIK